MLAQHFLVPTDFRAYADEALELHWRRVNSARCGL
jgi:hypothetical protein